MTHLTKQSNSIVPLLLKEYHKSPLGGHMGLAKILSHLHQNFLWTGMKQDIRLYIIQCSDCQQTKYIPQRPAGLLQPSLSPWEDMALDFITGLPNYQGAIVILAIVNRFSRGAHFGMLSTHFTAHKVVKLFIKIVCNHLQVPWISQEFDL